MKNRIILSILSLLLFLDISGYGQLTGTKTIPGNYASVAAAIADLNTQGAGPGGVTFAITAGYTETFVNRTDGLITTNTGSATNPISFVKNGTGASPVIYSSPAGTGNYDYIFCIGGTDYVTFDGIKVQDNPANTLGTNQAEYGFALMKASATDGPQHVTIKNCSVTLNKTNTNTVGIMARNWNYSTMGTNLTATSPAGSTSYTGLYNNAIQNVFSGIYLYGTSDIAPYGNYDQNNDIGSQGGNTITDFGSTSGSFYGIYTYYQNNMTVANNTITGTVGGGNSTCYGMQFQVSNNATTTVYNNYVSLQTTSTGSFYGIYDAQGTTATTSNSVTYYNNTITGCTMPNATFSTAYYLNIGHGAPNISVHDNTITNNVYGSATATATGTINYFYLNCLPTTLGTADVYNNNISNNTRIQSVPGGGSTYYLYCSPQSNTLNIYNNVVDNNVAASNGVTYGLYNTTNSVTKNIYGNTITNILNGAGTSVMGMNITGGYNWNVYKNKVQNINGTGINSTVTGIYLGMLSGAGAIYAYNNIIADLKAGVSNSATALNALWFFGSSATYAGIYDNTIYLTGSSTGTNYGAACLNISEYPATVDIRNNLFVNNANCKGTGKSVAVLTSAANAQFLNLSPYSNNNCYYAGTPSANNLIFYDGTNAQKDLLSYQTMIYPRENMTISENTSFVNTSSSPMDLHVNSSVPTGCESGGQAISAPISITTDFENNPRYPNAGYPNNVSSPANAPDIGADEFAGISVDIIPPTILYTPLSNTSSTSARILTATITDKNGVPVTGSGLPRLAWKKGVNGTYSYVTGTSMGSNQFTFNLGAGVALGDTVFYFVVAQDNAPITNVGCYPFYQAAGFTSNPPAVTTPPVNPSSYRIIPSICGTFQVGAGKTYNTLTAAVNDINSKEITCPITLLLTDATYPSETFPIILNGNTGSSSVNTLTVKPAAGVNALITGSSATGIFKINGFDNLIIDGSNNGTSSKNLIIQNTSTTAGAYTVGVYNKGGSDPANSILIANSVLRGATLAVSGIYTVLMDATGGGYDGIVLNNDSIYGGYVAVQISGSSSNIAHNCKVMNSVIGSLSAPVKCQGIYLQYADNTLISGNDIFGDVFGNNAPYQAGVYVFNGSTSTKITKNKIHDFFHNIDDGAGAWGIWYQSDNSTVTEISNNSIYGIKSSGAAPGASPNNPYGIFIRSGGNIKIVHNSIWLYGNVLSPTAIYDASSGCIGIYQTGALSNNIEIRNNILKNSMQGLSFCPLDGKAYAIMTVGDATNFSLIDYNVYFSDGCNTTIGFQNFNYLTTLAQWQAMTGQDQHSIQMDPAFTSPTNLIPTIQNFGNAGIYYPSVPTDINNVQRSNPPDIGAYEYVTDPLIVTDPATALTYSGATLNGSINASGYFVNTFFDYGLTTAYGSSTTGTPNNIVGATLLPYSSPISGLLPLTTYHFRARGVTSTGVTVWGNDLTFTTLPAPPAVITTAATGVSTNGGTLNGTVNPNGGTATISFEWGLTTSYGNSVTAAPSTATGTSVITASAPLTGLQPNTVYHYRIVAVNAGGTNYGNDMTFTTGAVAPSVVTNFATNATSSTATLNGTVTALNSSTTVSFQYGTTTAYGTTVAGTPSPVTGNTATAVLANITGLSINTTYHFRCVGVNSAGTTYGGDQVFTTNCVAPVITISGPATACVNSTGNVYTTQAGNSGYTWNISAGGTITSGAGTNSITVTWTGAGSQNVSVNYSNSYGCNANSPTVYSVTVNPQPVPTITGSATACQSTTGNTYSTQTGMNNYQWTVSAGGTITAGAGTNSIQVTWNGTGAQTISVNYSNSNGCYATSPTVLNVNVNPAAAPTISGSNSPCVNSGYYNYTTESGMTGYNWTVSAGGTITAGQGTSTVQISWTTAGNQTVTVNYNNSYGCSAPAPASMTVTVNPVPGNAGAVTGPSSVCGGATGVAYSTTAVANASTYVWTVPTGATIVSGAGTTSITVDFAANASSGNVTVYANNICGNGSSSSLPVTVTSLPAAAGTITGLNSVCTGTSSVSYTVAPVAGANSYVWAVPAGASIVSGAGTASILVDYSNNAQSGNVSVYGTNSCGDGQTSTLAVTVNQIPAAPVVTLNGMVLTSSAPDGNQWYFNGTAIPGATAQTYTATQSGEYWTVVTINGCSSDTSNHVEVIITGIEPEMSGGFVVYPVPNNGRFTIRIDGRNREIANLYVYDFTGERIYEMRGVEIGGNTEQIVDLRPVASGVYTIVVDCESGRFIRKIIVTQ